MNHQSVVPGPLPFHILEKITNGFSDERRLGVGGFGTVYMGLYENGEKIAIKILRPIPGLDNKQFETEFDNLHCLQHQNIVRLIGYCHETAGQFVQYNQKMVLADNMRLALCFEYMPNGSLENHLSDEYSGHSWHTRYAIIKGICKGLNYLHEELKPAIYHLDLKPANILLDEKLKPKIGDFGLSRLLGEKKTQIGSSCIGTRGYIPPECINGNVISNKFDIFSLGVVITEIIAGPKGYTTLNDMNNSEEFIELVHANWRSRLHEESMSYVESSLKLVRRCTVIALRCLEIDRHTRPTIGEILDELNEIETIIRFPHVLSIDGGSSTDEVFTSTDTKSTDAPQSRESDLMDASNNQKVVSDIKESELMDGPKIKSNKLLIVNPDQLRFPFEPNKWISCVLNLTNKTNDTKVAFRCIPQNSGIYFNDLRHLRGILPANSTCTFVGTMEKRGKPPSDMDQLVVIIESRVVLKEINEYRVDYYFEEAGKESGGKLPDVTLKSICETPGETITSKTIEPRIKLIYQNAGSRQVFSTDVHPMEPWILIGYSSGTIAIWNYKTQAKEMALKIAREDKEPGPFSLLRKKSNRTLSAFSAKFIARKQWLAAGDGFGYIHVHTYAGMSMEKVNKFYAHTSEVTSLAVHPSEPFVLSASRGKGIKLWDWEKRWKKIRTFNGHKHCVTQIVFNPLDSSTFASISTDGTAKIWHIHSPSPTATFTWYQRDCGRSINYFSTSDECQCLIAVSGEGFLRIWDLEGEKCVKSLFGGLQNSVGYGSCSVGVVDSLPDRPVILVTASINSSILFYHFMADRFKRQVYFGLGNVHQIAYIKDIKSVAIAFEKGLAIMEIMD